MLERTINYVNSNEEVIDDRLFKTGSTDQKDLEKKKMVFEVMSLLKMRHNKKDTVFQKLCTKNKGQKNYILVSI